MGDDDGEALPRVDQIDLDDGDRVAKAKALRLLENDRLNLLLLRPFIGSLCMNLRIVPVVDSRCVTACTDGSSVFFNAHWACNMPEEQRMAVLAHEVWHCGLLHFVREKGKLDNHVLWNYAIDHEVNTLLSNDGFELPEGCVLYKEHIGKSAEQIFEMLVSGELKPRGEIIDEHLSNVPSDQTAPDGAMEDGGGEGYSGPGGEHGTLWEGDGGPTGSRSTPISGLTGLTSHTRSGARRCLQPSSRQRGGVTTWVDTAGRSTYWSPRLTGGRFSASS